MLTKIIQFIEAVIKLMSTDIARVFMELVRLCVDVFNWIEERARRNKPVMMMECKTIHCYQCNKPTGAYLVGEEEQLVPVIVCGDCVEHDEEEPEEQPEEQPEVATENVIDVVPAENSWRSRIKSWLTRKKEEIS